MATETIPVIDLGPYLAGEPGAMPLRTRAWGLPAADGAWQAVALLHLGDARRSTATWTHGASAARRDDVPASVRTSVPVSAMAPVAAVMPKS